MKLILQAAMFVCLGQVAFAGDLEWSGLYRFEANTINNPFLDRSLEKSKDYGVHTLILRPKIVAADGLYINSQINIFNEASADGANQLGDYFGDGLGGTTYSNSLAQSQKENKVRMSQYYLTLEQEHGALLVGRAPIHFGLGITHNAGRGLFDHFSDTRDLVGYKMVMGNFYFLPMYAKINEGDLSGYDDVNEISMHLQYENPESDAAMGVMYQNRESGTAGNDVPAIEMGGAGASVSGDLNAKSINVFYTKETTNYDVGFEIAQQSGDSGVQTATGAGVKFGGFGFALDYNYHRPESKYHYGLKMGYATGDNPTTEGEFEGFIFDRNYDVATLLFNHALGRADLLHTKLLGRTEGMGGTVSDQPDVEAISNVTYFSPSIRRKWSDKWSLVTRLTMAILDDTTVDVAGTNYTADSNLGYELDVSLVYNIGPNIQWVNEAAYLMSGKAWRVDGQFDSDSLFGFVSRAAVSF